MHTRVGRAPAGHLELQATIPDVVWRQHKLFHPAGTTENRVLSVETIVLRICKRPALQALGARIFSVAYLQSSRGGVLCQAWLVAPERT